MKDLKNKVAVITGAASGIGRGLAIELAREGCVLALSDINQEGLEEIKGLVKEFGGRVSTYLVDVAKKEEVYNFAESVNKEFGQVDIVINNAGVIQIGPIKEVSHEDFEWIMNINVWGVIHGSLAFLPYLKKQEEASLINISSTYGLIGIPMHVPYCTSKFAVRGFTDSLKIELSNTSVKVSCVYPNLITTNIAAGGRYPGLSKYIETSQLVQNFYGLFKRTMSPDDCAKEIVKKSIKEEKPHVLVGTLTSIVDFLSRKMADSYFGIILNKMAYKVFGKDAFNKMTE